MCCIMFPGRVSRKLDVQLNSVTSGKSEVEGSCGPLYNEARYFYQTIVNRMSIVLHLSIKCLACHEERRTPAHFYTR